MAAHKNIELTSEEHRQTILLTAANMFINRGYTATTLRELANKENILCALVRVVLDGQFSAAEKLLRDFAAVYSGEQ